jgi:hypothetical protein
VFFKKNLQNWKSYLGVNVKKKDTCVSDVQKSVLNHSCSEEAKSIAAAALAAVRNATVTAAAASSRGKIEVRKVLCLNLCVLVRYC